VSTHLIVPFASTDSAAGLQARQSLHLPHLERLLGRMRQVGRLGGDAMSPNPPHEQALARALGWSTDDSALAHQALPWAAQRANELGLPGHEGGWGLLTPVHLHLGTDQVSLNDPAVLGLDEAASRQWLDVLRPLFDTEGFSLHWAAPDAWLARHPMFESLSTASLDRVIGRNVDPWLPDHRSARLLRRLQNEAQMLLYTHPLNDAREAAGQLTLNSFWLSGTGALPAATPAAASVRLDDRLRRPALTEDWAAWCEAWRALDAGPLAELAASRAPVQLTLCGERQAVHYQTVPQGMGARLAGLWRRSDVQRHLETL